MKLFAAIGTVLAAVTSVITRSAKVLENTAEYAELITEGMVKEQRLESHKELQQLLKQMEDEGIDTSVIEGFTNPVAKPTKTK